VDSFTLACLLLIKPLLLLHLLLLQYNHPKSSIPCCKGQVSCSVANSPARSCELPGWELLDHLTATTDPTSKLGDPERLRVAKPVKNSLPRSWILGLQLGGDTQYST
jgi:hypothetical protein